MIVKASEARGAFAAAYERSEYGFLAHSNVGYVRPNFGDFTGNVASWNVWKRDRHVGQAPAHPKIKMIQRTGLHADEDIVRPECRLWRVLVLKHVRPTVLMKDDSFHSFLLVGLNIACWQEITLMYISALNPTIEGRFRLEDTLCGSVPQARGRIDSKNGAP